MDKTTPLLTVTAAAELAGMHPQTLRKLDRLGLVCPQRTPGGSRRYSLADISTLREVADMVASGLTLEAIRRIISLEKELAALKEENRRLREESRQLREEILRSRQLRVFAAGREVVSLQQGTRIKQPKALVVWQKTERWL